MYSCSSAGSAAGKILTGSVLFEEVWCYLVDSFVSGLSREYGRDHELERGLTFQSHD